MRLPPLFTALSFLRASNGPVEFEAIAQGPSHASRVRQDSRHGRYDALLLVVAIIEHSPETHGPEAMLFSYDHATHLGETHSQHGGRVREKLQL